MPSVLSHIFFTIRYAQIEETLQQESFFCFVGQLVVADN